MSNQHKDLKSILLAGIIAAGVFAGAFGSIQLLGANAQSTTTSQTDSNGSTQPVETL